MADNTAIEWTDATWSPIRYRVRADAAEIAKAKGYTSLVQIASKMAGRVGQHCEHVSPGCEKCYSGTNQARCLPTNGTGLPFDRRSRDLVEPYIDEKALTEPLRWKRGRRIFVENQSDLFGEWIPDEMIDRVFAVIALCPQHTFQVLTKRAARARKYLGEGINVRQRIETTAQNLWWAQVKRVQEAASFTPLTNRKHWPLPNVWLGVSVEDQQRADERIPELLATPAAVRFVSAEPLLGPVDLGKAIPCGYYCDERVGHVDHPFWTKGITSPLDWVIVGGESGPGARPMEAAWAQSLRDQCVAAGVAFFFKQWGEHLPAMQDGAIVDGHQIVNSSDRPERIGKKRAGRLLDGREWNEVPTAHKGAL